MKRNNGQDGAEYGGRAIKKPNTNFSDGVDRGADRGADMAASRLTTNDALTYLRDVKNKFQDDRQVYETFLEIMKDFKAQQIDTAGVIARVKGLFKGHKHLIIGFNTFLPKGYEIRMEDLIAEEEAEKNSKQPVEFDQAINYVNKIKDRFRRDERVYKQFLEILNQYRKNQKGIAEVYNQVAQLFAQHDDLLEEFTYFLPDSQAPHQAAIDERARREAAAQRHVSQSDYYNSRKKRPGSRDPNFDMTPSEPPCLEKESLVFEKIKKKVSNVAWNEILKLLAMYGHDILNKHELLELTLEMFGGKHSELFKLFECFIQRSAYMDIDDTVARQVSRNVSGRGPILSKDKNQNVPMSELDFTDCERCSPSYVTLPKSFAKFTVSGREKGCGETLMKNLVFNDQYVSQTSGSEDYSFKLMRKNQYEEALFRVEDDRFELEMHIERNRSTIKRLTPIADEMDKMGPEEKQSMKLDDKALTSVQIRHITTIYGEQGATVIDLLRKNPCVAVPVIMLRLDQKGQEWQKVLADMERHWQRMFEQNYARSLDHRSFYFKSIDKKNLGNKQLLTELKDAADGRKNSSEHCLLLHTSLPPSIRLQPDLIYEMGQREVHDDVWLVLKCAAQVGLSTEMAASIQTFWSNVISPFFGTPAPDAPSLAVQETKVNHALVKIKLANPTPIGTPSGTPAPAGDRNEASGSGDGSAKRTMDGLSSSGDQDGAGTASTNAGNGNGTGDTSFQQNGQQELERASASNSSGQLPSGGPLAPTNHHSLEVGPTTPPSVAPAQAVSVEVPLSAPRSPAPRCNDDVMSEDDPEDDETRCGPVTDTEDDEAAENAVGGDVHPMLSDDDDDDDEASQDKNGEEQVVPGNVLRHIHSIVIEPESSGNHNFAPLQPFCPSERAVTLPHGMADERAPEKLVLYANEMMYFFIRLYQHLYDRLRTARICIRERLDAKRGKKDSSDNSANADGDVPSTPQEEEDETHAEFLALVQRLVTNKMDSSAFEDACRGMLGTNGYVLFTLDKLVSKVIKLVQNMLADDSCVKLINLHHYEQSRSAAACATTHLVNASTIFSDETCIRLASLQDGSLTMQLVDLDKPEVQPWPSDPDAQKFLTSFMNVGTGPRGVAGCPLFLRRNMDANIVNDMDSRVEHLASFVIRNGLESKLKQDEANVATTGNTATSRKAVQPRRFCYKINFVLDTEDAVVRKKMLQRSKPARGGLLDNKSRSLGKFRQFWDGQVSMVAAANPNVATSNPFDMSTAMHHL